MPLKYNFLYNLIISLILTLVTTTVLLVSDNEVSLQLVTELIGLERVEEGGVEREEEEGGIDEGGEGRVSRVRLLSVSESRDPLDTLCCLSQGCLGTGRV